MAIIAYEIFKTQPDECSTYRPDDIKSAKYTK